MIKISKTYLVLLLLTLQLNANEICRDSLFSISTVEQGVSISGIINKLSKECRYSVIIQDTQAEEIFKKELPSLYLNDVSLDEIFSIVLEENGLAYEYGRDILKVKYLVTKTFNVDFISTARKGVSNTKIALSGEGVSGDGGGGGGASGGDSKTEISSTDGFDFWEESLLKEINGILNRPEDAISFGGAEEGQRRNSIDQNSIVINKSAGLITVTGSKKQVDRVEEYIESLMHRLKSQVMIDVSILKVKHSKSNSTGINWKKFSATFDTKSGQRYSENDIFIYENPLSYTTAGWDVSLDVIVDFLEGYGDVSSVSNPKVLTLNNQPSLISVGSIFYYKEIDTESDNTGDIRTTTTDVTYIPLFVGVLLDITPSVYGDEIMLKINPTVTKTKGVNIETQETALEEPPNLDSNQLSSIIKVKDGQKIILGGLISKSKSEETSKVPLLGDLPLVGYAFKHKEKIHNIDEMVIVITPRIVKVDNDFSLKDLGYVMEYEDAEVNTSESGFSKYETDSEWQWIDIEN